MNRQKRDLIAEPLQLRDGPLGDARIGRRHEIRTVAIDWIVGRAGIAGDERPERVVVIRRDAVHAISCTGANLEEDIFSLLGRRSYVPVPNYQELSAADELALYEQGLYRVTDVCIPEDEAVAPANVAAVEGYTMDPDVRPGDGPLRPGAKELKPKAARTVRDHELGSLARCVALPPERGLDGRMELGASRSASLRGLAVRGRLRPARGICVCVRCACSASPDSLQFMRTMTPEPALRISASVSPTLQECVPLPASSRSSTE